MLNREVPFIRITLPLAGGIVAGHFISLAGIFIVLLSALALSGFAVSPLFNRRPVNVIFGISMTLGLFSAGIILYCLQKKSLSVLPEKEITLMCTASEYPEEREKSFRLLAGMNARLENDSADKLNGFLLLYFNKDSFKDDISPGDILLIKIVPRLIKNRGNPCEFDYRFYMENRGCRYYSFVEQKDILKHIVPLHRKLIHKALIIREAVTEMYKTLGITGDRLAIVSAITLGYRELVDEEQRQEFIRAGVMHIMAVSGLHAGIVSLFISNIVLFLRKKFKWLSVIITLSALWMFAFITGLSSSVLRAVIMFSFLHAGGLMRRHVNSINSVLASAFVQMLIRPSVVFDSGFLLSYSAVIFLICFYREFYLKINFKNRLANRIWQAALVTIVAQLGTLPLTLTLFNRFPLLFLIVNIVVVPLVSIVVIAGCLIPLIFPLRFLSELIARGLDFIAGFIGKIVHFASDLPFSTLNNIGMTGIECLLLSGFIFFFLQWMINKETVIIKVPLAILLLFITTGSIKDIVNKRSAELIVYNSLNSTCVALREGKTLNIYHNSVSVPPEPARHASVTGLKIEKQNLNTGTILLKAGGKIICITDHISAGILNFQEPVIFILKGRKPSVDKEIIGKVNDILAIVISSEAGSGYKIPGIKKEDRLFYVGKSGAFRMNLAIGEIAGQKPESIIK
ncbi:MAG: ComEC/Rec2 family competence protein [Bacteroidales bacterium]|nr:ComEC/Rec2 family competence protein [Bacteroidales bacterium]